ncbi:MAG: peptidoglycan bridge formation glycyltransferase FemA/FemB family protein [Candidatus Doudnabacteria bacterium]
MITPLSQDAWDEKVIELGGSILQSWVWGEFQESLGQKIHRFSGEDFACLAIETALPFGKKYAYCPRGPLGNIDPALVDLKKLDEDHSIIFSRIEPLQSVKLPRAVKDTQPAIDWVLDLEKTEEELLIGMKPKTRYNINLSQRKGVVVREGTQADLITVWQLLLETANRNKIRLHPQSYYFQMWDHLAPKYLKILIAEYKGQPLAGLLLSLFGDTATFLHGGTSQKMKEAMAPHLLHWEAIRLARNLGFKHYDFGGVAPAKEESHAWAGISRFKKGFGGFEVKYPGSFDLIFSPIWYNVYKQGRTLKKILSTKS